jgi:hypothetical protein
VQRKEGNYGNQKKIIKMSSKTQKIGLIMKKCGKKDQKFKKSIEGIVIFWFTLKIEENKCSIIVLCVSLIFLRSDSLYATALEKCAHFARFDSSTHLQMLRSMGANISLPSRRLFKFSFWSTYKCASKKVNVEVGCRDKKAFFCSKGKNQLECRINE